jgi:hypothetical protein
MGAYGAGRAALPEALRSCLVMGLQLGGLIGFDSQAASEKGVVMGMIVGPLYRGIDHGLPRLAVRHTALQSPH